MCLQSQAAGGKLLLIKSSHAVLFTSLLLTNGNKSAVWRPITNHSSAPFNPFVSTSDQNEKFLDSKRKELVNSLNLQPNRKALARVVSPSQPFKPLVTLPRLPDDAGEAFASKKSQGSDVNTVMSALST